MLYLSHSDALRHISDYARSDKHATPLSPMERCSFQVLQFAADELLGASSLATRELAQQRITDSKEPAPVLFRLLRDIQLRLESLEKGLKIS